MRAVRVCRWFAIVCLLQVMVVEVVMAADLNRSFADIHKYLFCRLILSNLYFSDDLMTTLTMSLNRSISQVGLHFIQRDTAFSGVCF